jgi:hypothetical protein
MGCSGAAVGDFAEEVKGGLALFEISVLFCL